MSEKRKENNRHDGKAQTRLLAVKMSVDANLGKPYKKTQQELTMKLKDGFDSAFLNSAANLKKGEPQAKAIYQRCIVDTNLFTQKAQQAMANVVKNLKKEGALSALSKIKGIKKP